LTGLKHPVDEKIDIMEGPAPLAIRRLGLL
jgi:hypothetical protein